MSDKKQEATMDDVLAAVSGVGQKVDRLAIQVDAVERRVTALERQPALKTRVMHQDQNGNGRPAAVEKPRAVRREQVIPRHDDDRGEDEAVASGSWAKIIKKNRCNRVSLTKTRKRDCWKMILSLPGRSRPATFIGWDGPEQILMMFGEVMPELSLDDFDNTAWAKKDRGQDRPPIMTQWDVNFMVEWFQTAPTGHNGATFITVETVYPLYEEEA